MSYVDHHSAVGADSAGRDVFDSHRITGFAVADRVRIRELSALQITVTVQIQAAVVHHAGISADATGRDRNRAYERVLAARAIAEIRSVVHFDCIEETIAVGIRTGIDANSSARSADRVVRGLFAQGAETVGAVSNHAAGNDFGSVQNAIVVGIQAGLNHVTAPCTLSGGRVESVDQADFA